MDSKSNLDKAEKRVGNKRLIKFYIIPFFAAFIFILVIVILVIPKISDIFATLDEITALSTQSQTKKDTLTQLNTLAQDSNFLLAQLDIINNTAPVGNSEVVVFRNKITDLCRANNLVVVTQRLSESDINRNANNVNTLGLSLLEIPIVFEINGSYQDMLGFINDLSSLEDFLIVREMKLESSLANNIQLTTLKLRVDKYQFSVLNQDQLDIQYLQVPSEAKVNEIILNYVNRKISN